MAGSVSRDIEDAGDQCLPDGKVHLLKDESAERLTVVIGRSGARRTLLVDMETGSRMVWLAVWTSPSP